MRDSQTLRERKLDSIVCLGGGIHPSGSHVLGEIFLKFIDYLQDDSLRERTFLYGKETFIKLTMVYTDDEVQRIIVFSEHVAVSPHQIPVSGGLIVRSQVRKVALSKVPYFITLVVSLSFND